MEKSWYECYGDVWRRSLLQPDARLALPRRRYAEAAERLVERDYLRRESKERK